MNISWAIAGNFNRFLQETGLKGWEVARMVGDLIEYHHPWCCTKLLITDVSTTLGRDIEPVTKQPWNWVEFEYADPAFPDNLFAYIQEHYSHWTPSHRSPGSA